jgi:hypothetical protein
MARAAAATSKRPAAHPVRTLAAPLEFVGCLRAIVAVLPVAREAARAMLPAGLDLAAQDVVARDRHPLVLVLGRQSGVRPRLLPFGADYLEFILAVPFVERRAGAKRASGPFCYPARLYLDRALPTVAGRLLYAYDKRRAAIQVTADSYRIADAAGGRPLLEARFRTVGERVAPSWMPAALFDQPVISRAATGWRYSVADLGLERALVQPVELRLSIHRPFVPGLPTGEFRFAGSNGDAPPAVRIRTNWRLAGPWARRSPGGLPR